MKAKTKRCPKCKETKPSKNFHRNKRTKDGRDTYCKECRKILDSVRYCRNRERVKACGKRRREEQPERVAATNKKWREDNREEVAAYGKEWREGHKEEVAAYNKEWREDNRESSNAKFRAYKRRNPKYKLSRSIGSGMYRSLKGNKNGNHWEDLVSYTLEDLMNHLEKLFKPGMAFENHGEWHIDHKIPVSAFSFTKPKDSDFKRCWALSNLQPLWAEENLRKHDKIDLSIHPA